jgi:hypothetical protein
MPLKISLFPDFITEISDIAQHFFNNQKLGKTLEPINKPKDLLIICRTPPPPPRIN